MKKHPKLIAFCLFLLLALIAFCVRTYHYNTSVERLGVMTHEPTGMEKMSELRKFFPVYHTNFAPFTIESAMMFGYSRDVAEGKGVPASDPRLAGMEDLAPYAQMNMALEWFLGWGWKIRSIFPTRTSTASELRFQDNPAMAQWMSLQLRLWASLTTGFLFLWLLAMRCPKTLAFCGGLLHAISLAAIARATGQDFVRGEFCIPLYTACLALAWSCYAKPKYWKYVLIFFCTALAFAAWDLCQMLFGIWILCELLHFLLGYRITKQRMIVWSCIAAAIAVNAAFVPFNRAYSLWRAPIVWCALPSLGLVFLCSKWQKAAWFSRKFWTRLIPALCVPVLLYAAWSFTINTPEYASNYSHFSSAMKAKLRFRNVKPEDPRKLDYDARILWTPSMHSATWDIANSFFPSFFFGKKSSFTPYHFFFGDWPLTLGAYFLMLTGALIFSMPRHTFFSSCRIALLPHIFTVGFTIAFVYIVRYHEFVILFLSAALPLLFRDYLRTFRVSPAKVDPAEAYTKIYAMPRLLRFSRGCLLTLGIFLLFWEGKCSATTKRRYTGDVQFAGTNQLIRWFRRAPEAVKGKIVSTNITIGPMLMAYAGTGISMNPQFGLKRIRDATEEFYKALFAPGEKAMVDYCNKYHTDYVLYNNGALFDISIYSTRYIAGAVKLPPDCFAGLLYYRPDRLQNFYEVQIPADLPALKKTYRLFKVIRKEDRREAADLTLDAETCFRKGEREKAAVLAEQALLKNPDFMGAKLLYLQLYPGSHPSIGLGKVTP